MTPEQLASLTDNGIALALTAVIDTTLTPETRLQARDILAAEINRRGSALAELQGENERLRKILAHVPAKVALAAKEKAGFGETIKLTDAARAALEPKEKTK